jgi:plastocyanin
MKTGRLTFLIALAAAAAVIASANAAAATPKLTGEVGPGFTIVLKQGSKNVKTLKAGTYVLKVEDKGSIHNFHLFGPAVNKSTGVTFTGATTWTVKLKKGTYTFQCDPHAAAGMQGTFRVTG